MDSLPEHPVPAGVSSSDDARQEASRTSDGCALGCVALMFAAPAVWIYWMVRKFADGDGWFDFAVRLVLDELVLAIGLFVLVLLIWSIFAPPWLAPIVDWAIRHMAQVVFCLFVGLLGSLLLFILVYAVLSACGVRF